MPAIDLHRALQYVDEHGNLQDKARLLNILMAEIPPDTVVRPLLAKQNPDGGFPSRPRTTNPSSVDNTLTALWQLNEVGLLDSAEAKRALEFLISVQGADGGWDENPNLPEHDLPPWIVPGQQPTRLYLTAYTAYWLGLLGRTGLPAFQRAVRFLMAQQQPDGRIPGYLHAHWIGASALLMAGPPAREAAEKAVAFLQNIPAGQWEDSQIAWALDCLGSAGLAADHPLISGLLVELAGRQDPQGCWSSEDGPAYAVSATLSALKALKRFGLIQI